MKLCFVGLVLALWAPCILGDNVVKQEEIDSGSYELLMPGVRPNKAELRLCTQVKINSKESYYITSFEPKASMDTVHHMLLYGCSKPGSTVDVWNCGEMETDSYSLDQGTIVPACSQEDSQVLYAWARNAPMLKLPEDVSFKIGKDTDIQYFVLEIHYAAPIASLDGSSDTSGVVLQYTRKPTSKFGAVLLLLTGGEIQPRSVESMEVACTIREHKTIHPFAYRVHTHSLGMMVNGYKVSQVDDVDQWTLIGKQDPSLPQMFYPVEGNITLKYGDAVAANCKMYNYYYQMVSVGPTAEDEMCNFYLMYWVENTNPLNRKYCSSVGPPYYRWENYFRNVPPF